MSYFVNRQADINKNPIFSENYEGGGIFGSILFVFYISYFLQKYLVKLNEIIIFAC